MHSICWATQPSCSFAICDEDLGHRWPANGYCQGQPRTLAQRDQQACMAVQGSSDCRDGCSVDSWQWFGCLVLEVCQHSHSIKSAFSTLQHWADGCDGGRQVVTLHKCPALSAWSIWAASRVLSPIADAPGAVAVTAAQVAVAGIWNLAMLRHDCNAVTAVQHGIGHIRHLGSGRPDLALRRRQHICCADAQPPCQLGPADQQLLQLRQHGL